jgi:hypothetical protein
MEAFARGLAMQPAHSEETGPWLITQLTEAQTPRLPSSDAGAGAAAHDVTTPRRKQKRREIARVTKETPQALKDSALREAVQEGHLEEIQHLLRVGADPASEKEGRNTIHHARLNKNEKATLLLLRGYKWTLEQILRDPEDLGELRCLKFSMPKAHRLIEELRQKELTLALTGDIPYPYASIFDYELIEQSGKLHLYPSIVYQTHQHTLHNALVVGTTEQIEECFKNPLFQIASEGKPILHYLVDTALKKLQEETTELYSPTKEALQARWRSRIHKYQTLVRLINDHFSVEKRASIMRQYGGVFESIGATTHKGTGTLVGAGAAT